ncbi:MAG TPA: ribose-phosphate diphosphokinase [Armatimonadota bacterium]
MVLLHAAAQVAAPLLYAFPDYQPLAAGLHRMVDVRDGNFARGRFANGELYIQLHTLPDRAHCIALGTIAPPDEQLLALVLLCHTLRKEGAGEITALLPYLAYARQDRDEPGRSRAIGWMGTALQDAGITEIVTVDIHSRQAVELFPIPVFSLAPAALYAAEIQNLAWQHAALVAPDAGAVGRCEAVKEAGGLTGPIIHLRKERTADGVHSELEGNAESQAVIIDDMLDTGETLLACCQALRQAGTERIMIMVTHGLFTGTAWERLWDLGVERLFCMDTVPHPAMRDDERIRTISALPLIAEFFQHNS